MNGIAEALLQVRQGMDFAAPSKVLKISAERAVAKKDGWPYSIADNIAHADYWQCVWLARLMGERRPKMDPKLWDWPVVLAEQWHEVRAGFLQNLDRSLEIATANPFVHKMKTDEAAAKALLEIAIHDAYHIGQAVLLKRLLER